MRKPQWYKDGLPSGIVTLRVAMTRNEIDDFEKYANLRGFDDESHAWDYTITLGIAEMVRGFDPDEAEGD